MPLFPGIYRADHVGSLLWPVAVKKARKEHAEGTITAAQLRAVEDQVTLTLLLFSQLLDGSAFTLGCSISCPYPRETCFLTISLLLIIK